MVWPTLGSRTAKEQHITELTSIHRQNTYLLTYLLVLVDDELSSRSAVNAQICLSNTCPICS